MKHYLHAVLNVYGRHLYYNFTRLLLFCFLFSENTHALHMGQGVGRTHNLRLQLCAILVAKVDDCGKLRQVKLIVLLRQVKTKAK